MPALIGLAHCLNLGTFGVYSYAPRLQREKEKSQNEAFSARCKCNNFKSVMAINQRRHWD